MDVQPLISVVLATYNGSKYLVDQLESIYKQTYKNIEVIVCDDRSTDATEEILKIYKESHQLEYIINDSQLGIIENFAKVIFYAKGDYIALSDQDDVWLPDKLELSFKRMCEMEREFSKDIPLLVYSDLKVVDEKLRCIAPSYWKYRKLNQEKISLNKILVENLMTGCTSLMNKATVNLALPIPKQALMHDVWFLLVAFCFGKTSCLNEQTVLYRQHSNNVIGSISKKKSQKVKIILKKIKNKNLGLLNNEINQAKAFCLKFTDRLMEMHKERFILQTFISLKDKNFITRRICVIKHSFYGNSFGRFINVLLRV